MLLPPAGNAYTPYVAPSIGGQSLLNVPSLVGNTPFRPVSVPPVGAFPTSLPPLPLPVLNNRLLVSPSALCPPLTADVWCYSANPNPSINQNQGQQGASPCVTANPPVSQPPDYAGYMHRFLDNYRDTGMADATFRWVNDTYHQCRGPLMDAMGRLVMHV